MTAASPGVIAPVSRQRALPQPRGIRGQAVRTDEGRIRGHRGSGVSCCKWTVPDLAMGRHMKFANASDQEFFRASDSSLEALNHATRDIPPGPDAPSSLLGQLRRAPPQGHPPEQCALRGPPGEATSHLLRGGQPSPRARVGGVPRDETAGRQGHHPWRGRLHYQLHRAPAVGGPAHRALCSRSRPR